ncbi:DEAD/DEAH box helicase [Pararcticibacter amylolyticus]|uniref:DEAD-box ATP-dependent RNA helicase RhpA n=1 Tax=Pararcticibacter amylolyticus TaxID=2173175 RepID=A0A2U2PM56_9SPHI|nr:DEAD/DEAH box helicase [Pararcticibacter amylolyticus]PWG82486.1 DEAD/DEAH box helicase [Pararcticibacter amylolyticus]
MLFENLNLSPSILKALKTEGYVHPTPIQEASIPAILEKKDLLGCAQTGTGKTAAFALPILHLLQAREAAKGRKEIAALILTPTRELAIQISESFSAYGKHTSLKHAVVFGGVSAHSQVTAIKGGIDILVATPGRLLDLMSQKVISLQHIQLFVLDEADRMLDMGFINDVKKVIAKLPVKRQTLFFSATMPPEIDKLASTILHNPVKVEVTPVSSTAEKVTQAVYSVEKKDKPALLVHILQNKEIKRVLVFTRTKYGADKLAKVLNRASIKADAIHGNKTQNARQKALNNFKDGSIRVLVATDIAARGIDVEELKYVINFELPNQPETYVHRIGRTGRAGNQGTALSFCDQEEQEYLRDINKLTAQDIRIAEDHPYHLPVKKDARALNVKPGAARPSEKKNSSRRRPFNKKKKRPATAS